MLYNSLSQRRALFMTLVVQNLSAIIRLLLFLLLLITTASCSEPSWCGTQHWGQGWGWWLWVTPYSTEEHPYEKSTNVWYSYRALILLGELRSPSSCHIHALTASFLCPVLNLLSVARGRILARCWLLTGFGWIFSTSPFLRTLFYFKINKLFDIFDYYINNF